MICFLFSLFMFMAIFQNWNIAFVEYLYEISLFIPLFAGVLGVISACFSVKGLERIALLSLNALMVIYLGGFSFVAIYGFQDP
ncbi:hypothetical protein SAMN04487944_101604 [Gracilibacillus ureilyticus]|uniref:Uncharacterized protein n=1 Tax=Gracilibacillus ureilyticus TaxID=531814 RepID=A0A1H9M8J0_9BACI|nr:hypothetical protein SAMN04487944_101604 [Gracilibacillus ureilyticus]